ncbi:hypothetical protein K505DRAFT_331525 [Melanomma pulvis-pyrius CBS 109.77]|uniref:Uncharacterized protein n=1 Tax=Melanomma pulvis-pyrius CBS 109.77 TaxID=1314802 RepID=A0A6A6XWP3_9PLEO|nr:hypothetical protein K505DRAFT_331525 [Melanomma pulvis-pyrius CBS 109.77]
MIFTAVLRFRVAGLSHLPILSPTARARAYAGHSQEQWQRFYPSFSVCFKFSSSICVVPIGFFLFTSSLIYPSTLPTNTPKNYHLAHSNPIQTNPNQAITNKEGYLLHSKNTNWRWGTVPAEERVDLKDRVNAALKEEEVPEVDEFTLSWRMSRVFSWMQKQCMSPSLYFFHLFHCVVKGEKPRRRWYKTDPNTTPISTTTTTAEQEEVS